MNFRGVDDLASVGEAWSFLGWIGEYLWISTNPVKSDVFNICLEGNKMMMMMMMMQKNGGVSNSLITWFHTMSFTFCHHV